MQTTTSPLPSTAEIDPDSFYPCSDGRPLGEAPAHFRNSLLLYDALEARFAGEPQVYVAGNMLVYYVPGDRLKHVSPDIFIAFGVPKDKPRKSYRVWEEGKAPELVVELTSKTTEEEDIDDKKWIYRDILGVREYILFYPHDEYLDPPLQGFRLQGGEYVTIPLVSDRLPSEVLGLHFEVSGNDLRLYDPVAGQWLLTPEEVRALADATAIELDRALADRARLEAELAELRRRVGDSGP